MPLNVTGEFEEIRPSVAIGAVAAAPAAAAAISGNLTPGAAGLYMIEILVSNDITSGIGADEGNFSYEEDAANVIANIPCSPGTPTRITLFRRLTATTVLAITAAGNATAATVYAASIIATRLTTS